VLRLPLIVAMIGGDTAAVSAAGGSVSRGRSTRRASARALARWRARARVRHTQYESGGRRICTWLHRGHYQSSSRAQLGTVTRAHFDAKAGPHGALIVGGPDEAVDKIRHYDEVLGGITRLTFQMDHTALPHATLRSIELLGTRVAPALQTPALVSV
jgi:alkanesulfonate monooxygenase SsuD/methylene tetrahydromethanopterin reductase-like flavin-dependent oxidoreductase (luciferase family)